MNLLAGAGTAGTRALRRLVLLLPILALVLLLPAVAFASEPPTQSYPYLSAQWWPWAAASPAKTNPQTDPTGAQCANHQSGPVWFLAGVYGGGSASRRCSVPAGKALFFPVANSFSCPDLGQTSTFAAQRTAARNGFTDVSGLAVTFDGRSLPASRIRYTESFPFTLMLKADNVFGAPVGTYRPCADVGDYVLIPPLSPGEHTLHFMASQNGKQIQSVCYAIVVVRPSRTS